MRKNTTKNEKVNIMKPFYLACKGYEYGQWCRMMQWCYSPKNIFYDRYGKRGYTVTEKWENDELFLFYNKDFIDIRLIWKSYNLGEPDEKVFSNDTCSVDDSNFIEYCKKERRREISRANKNDPYSKLLGSSMVSITPKWLYQFEDKEKLKVLLRYIKNGNTTLRVKRYRIDYYKNFVKHFYYDDQFNRVYRSWVKSGKQRLLSPALDHIIPKSKGGSDHLSNLQFIPNFENYCKGAMDLDEWENIKRNVYDYFV